MGSPYGALAGAKLRSLASSPRLLMLRSAGDVVIVAMEALAPLLLVSRFGSIAGWSGAEVVMLIGVARTGEGLALIVGRGIDPNTFGDTIRLGRFDQILTRPVSPLLWLLTSDVELRFVFRAAAGAGVVAWSAHSLGVLSLGAAAVLAAAAVASALFVLSTLVIGAAMTFRTVEGSDFALLLSNGGMGLAAFPLEVYGSALRLVFTFLVPVGLCVYVPVLSVLDRDGPGVLGPGLLPVLPIVLGVFGGLSLLAWRQGIRHYESTGS